MTDIADLGRERVKRENDNKKVTVSELLQLALDELAAGELGMPIRCVILIESENSNEKTYSFNTYRSGVSHYEEVALLELAQAQAIERWRLLR